MCLILFPGLCVLTKQYILVNTEFNTVSSHLKLLLARFWHFYMVFLIYVIILGNEYLIKIIKEYENKRILI